MGRRNVEKRYFVSNVIWLNLKRLSHQLGWRLLTFFINLMFIFLFVFKLNITIFCYVFLIVTFSNILFIITRIQAEKDSIVLLRSFGASKFFIIFDHIFQSLFQIIIAFLIFILVFPILFFFRKISLISFVFLLIEIAIVIITSFITSYFNILKLEKELNA